VDKKLFWNIKPMTSNDYATKQDIRMLKQELNGAKGELKQEINNLEVRVDVKFKLMREEMRDGFSQMEKRFDEAFGKLDGFVKILQKVDQEQSSMIQRQDDMEEDVTVIKTVPIIAQQLRPRKKH